LAYTVLSIPVFKPFSPDFEASYVDPSFPGLQQMQQLLQSQLAGFNPAQLQQLMQQQQQILSHHQV
jgi:hypothetical protein